jgi:hypothetical protein
MKVAVMANCDQALYISSTHQPAKQIPRNAQVWKAVGRVTKKGPEDIPAYAGTRDSKSLFNMKWGSGRSGW